MNRICFSLALATTALAQDPPAPPGGWNVLTATHSVTFSDGHSTMVDVYWPDAPQPNTGWPAVQAMHGQGGHRALPKLVATGHYLAQVGYVVFSYDIRSGSTQELDLLDAAEMPGLIDAAVGNGLMDLSRFGMTGLSGGGRKSLSGAAWSEKPLPLTGFVTHFPKVGASVPEIAPIDGIAIDCIGGTMASDKIVIGKPITHPWIAAIDAQDYLGLQALVSTSFSLSLLTELQTSEVPMLAMWAMQDFKITNNASIDAFLAKPGTNRMFLSTSGHSTVDNAMEEAVMEDLRRRWFDRYLKGIQNGVELEPFVEIGMQPSTNAAHLDLRSRWEHRQFDTWPPAIASQRLHLHPQERLAESAPSSAATADIRHNVPAGYDIEAYIDLNGPGAGGGLEPTTVLANVPADDEVFTTRPLVNEMEIAGRPRVKLTVDDITGYFQLTGILESVDTSGTAHWITAGSAGWRSGSPGRHVIEFDLGDVGHIVPAGHRLRLRLSNIADINAPNSRRIRYVPYFTSTITRIGIAPSHANFIDLPMRPYTADLLPRLASTPASAGIDHRMQLRGGAQRAGQPYFLLMGCSGEAPGASIAGTQLPINYDFCTDIGLGALNTPVLPASLGVLDATGRATPGFAIPPAIAPLLAGMRMTFVGVVLDPSTPSADVIGSPANLLIDR